MPIGPSAPKRSYLQGRMRRCRENRRGKNPARTNGKCGPTLFLHEGWFHCHWNIVSVMKAAGLHRSCQIVPRPLTKDIEACLGFLLQRMKHKKEKKMGRGRVKVEEHRPHFLLEI
jgi:hypothetical protein